MGNESVYTSWMYRDRRPPSDSAYFENLSRCVFQSGLNWATIASKWPAFREAFDGFEIARVAGYGSVDIARLMGNEKIIRNRKKILATIHNAREFERIVKESGSIPSWLDSLDKSNNYYGIILKSASRFKHVGATSVPLWLYSVGEDIDVTNLVEARFRK
jgi:3-methyladenine DNA glycosylase Tag